jgi:hypothetical protein
MRLTGNNTNKVSQYIRAKLPTRDFNAEADAMCNGFRSSISKETTKAAERKFNSMKSYVKMFLMAVATVVMMTTFAAADTPGAHPAYLHALSALREARAHLDVGTPNYRLNQDEQRAISEIDAAIKEVRDAAIDDGKPAGFRPRIDERLDGPGRLRHAMELLDSAHQDVDAHESDIFAKGLKKRALHHIDEARNAVHHAMEARHW